MGQFVVLVLVPLALAAVLPLLGDAYERRFWLVFSGVAVVVLVGALAWPAPTDAEAAPPLAVGLFLLLVPVFLAFLVCTESFLNERRGARALAGPLAYFVGLVVGLTIGVNLGVFVH